MNPRPVFKDGWLQHGSPALAALLCYGILTLWISDRWALGVYQAAALAACAAWGVRMAFGKVRTHWSGLLIPLALIPLWGVAQLVSGQTIYRWATGISALNWTVNFALFFLALQLLAEPRRRQRFLLWLLYFGTAVSILSTVQMFTSGGKVFWLFPSGYSDFVLGPFIYKNQYAAFIETVLPVALYYGVTRHKPLRYWVMAGVMVASVIAAASRTGTVLVLAEVGIIPLLATARGIIRPRTAVLALAGGIALSALFTTVVGWSVVWNRFQEHDPYAIRREMLLSSVHMAQDRPMMGFGLGTWPTAYPAYALYDDGTFANQAHNDWAQWTVEGGLPLLGLMLLFALLLARAAWRAPWGFGLLSVLIHGFVDYPMQQRPALAGWFFAVAGVLAAADSVKEPDIGGGWEGASQ